MTLGITVAIWHGISWRIIMKIAYITQNINATLVGTLAGAIGEVELFSSFDEFTATTSDSVAIIISTGFGSRLIEPFIYIIRRSSLLCLTPIFFETDGKFSSYFIPISISELKLQISTVLELALELDMHNYSSWENRIFIHDRRCRLVRS